MNKKAQDKSILIIGNEILKDEHKNKYFNFSNLI